MIACHETNVWLPESSHLRRALPVEYSLLLVLIVLTVPLQFASLRDPVSMFPVSFSKVPVIKPAAPFQTPRTLHSAHLYKHCAGRHRSLPIRSSRSDRTLRLTSR